MNDTEPLSDEEFRAAMLEFVAINELRKQLEAAHEYIGELRRQLCDQTAMKIAEVNYGYREALPQHGWHGSDEALPASQLAVFKKTNTEVLTATAFVANEERTMAHHGAQREQAIKQQLMDQLWAEMQRRGLFWQTERKVEHETIYTIGIEVARA